MTYVPYMDNLFESPFSILGVMRALDIVSALCDSCFSEALKDGINKL